LYRLADVTDRLLPPSPGEEGTTGTLKSVADLCKEHGVDHKQLSERTGLDDRRVLAIVQGRWTPNPSERDNVTAAFGLNRGPITWEH
jgi:hypothetical protein